MSADLIEQLAKWRHFPGYQLERRLDIFIAPYLQSFLEESDDSRLKDFTPSPPKSIVAIPELPLSKAILIENGYVAKNRKDEIIRAKDARRYSKKVDYGLFAKQVGKLVLLELKTDVASVGLDQVQYLVAAREAGWPELVRGLSNVIEGARGSARMKYNCLLEELKDVGAIEEISDNLNHKLYDKPLIVYLLPARKEELEGHDVIQLPFNELAEEVLGPKARDGDKTAGALLKLLLHLQYPAGSP